MLTVHILRPARPVVVIVTGEADLATVGLLKAALRTEPADDLVVDLAHVRFFSVAGVRELIDEHERRCRCGFRLVLVGAPYCVHLMLRVMDADLPVLPTLADATAAVVRAGARQP